MDKITAYKIARSYIAGGVTMETLAQAYGVSKPTIVRLLSGATKGLLDDDILNQIAEIKLARSYEAKSRGKENRTKIISPESAQRMAIKMIDEGLTLADLHIEGGPSIGTIYNSFTEENLGPVLYSMVVNHYALNKSQATRNCPTNIKSRESRSK